MDEKKIDEKAEAYKEGLKGAQLAAELPEVDNLKEKIAGFEDGMEEIKRCSVANTYEPLPKEGKEFVYLEVQKLIEARVKFGFEKYGVYLMTHNGRDALNDITQELLDALFYITQLRMENKTLNKEQL